jgi:hypothetical protein
MARHDDDEAEDLYDDEFDFVDDDDLDDEVAAGDDEDGDDSDLDSEIDSSIADEAEEAPPARKPTPAPAPRKPVAAPRSLFDEPADESVPDRAPKFGDGLGDVDAEDTDAEDNVGPEPIDDEKVDEYGRPAPLANYLVHIYEYQEFKRTVDRPFTPEDAEAFASEYNRTSKPYGRFAVTGKDDVKPRKELD